MIGAWYDPRFVPLSVLFHFPAQDSQFMVGQFQIIKITGRQAHAQYGVIVLIRQINPREMGWGQVQSIKPYFGSPTIDVASLKLPWHVSMKRRRPATRPVKETNFAFIEPSKVEARPNSKPGNGYHEQ